nr:hypothetical protein [Chroococcidiopsis sp. CCALA 051]
MNQAGFTILVTTDRNLRYQQNLPQSGVSIVVMVAASNRLSDLVPLVSNVRHAIDTIAIGKVVEVTG